MTHVNIRYFTGLGCRDIGIPIASASGSSDASIAVAPTRTKLEAWRQLGEGLHVPRWLVKKGGRFRTVGLPSNPERLPTRSCRSPHRRLTCSRRQWLRLNPRLPPWLLGTQNKEYSSQASKALSWARTAGCRNRRGKSRLSSGQFSPEFLLSASFSCSLFRPNIGTTRSQVPTRS